MFMLKNYKQTNLKKTQRYKEMNKEKRKTT